MAGYGLVSIVWHQQGHRIDLNYVHGEPEHMMGSEAITTMLAKDAGLDVVPPPDDTRRWVHRHRWHHDRHLDPHGAVRGAGSARAR